MDGREYGSGYTGWGGGGSSNAGSAPYDPFAYESTPSSGYGGPAKSGPAGGGGGGYGGPAKSGPPGGGYGGPVKSGPPGVSVPPSSGNSSADAVIAKINQRLDMLTQMEGGTAEGQGERFDKYESFDSGSSALEPRDHYRSGNFVYGGSRGGMMAQRGGMGYGAMGGAGGGGGFDGSASFGSPKMRQARDTFSGSSWDAGHWSPYRGGRPGGPGFGYRQDSSIMGGGGRSGGQGHFPSGRGKPPSLFSHHMYPDNRGFQPQPSSQFGNRRSTRQRFRKRPFKRIRDGLKKRKMAQEQADEPESKVGRTEDDGNKDAGDAAEEKKDDGAPDAESTSEAKGQSADENPVRKSQKLLNPPSSKYKTKRGFESRTKLTFSCSICKFRSFYGEDMESHLKSNFHKDHFRFLSYQLTKPTADFLQEYTKDKFRKTAQRVSELENHSATICQILIDQDQTKGISMENFVRKVEAAHCSACNMYIPMQPAHIQKHLKSAAHRYKRKMMMEQSKLLGLSVARNILDNDSIGNKLERYLKGENPFTGNKVEENPDDSTATEVPEGEAESKPEDKQEEAEPTGDGAPEEAGEGKEAGEDKEAGDGKDAGDGIEEGGGEEKGDEEKEGESEEIVMEDAGEDANVEDDYYDEAPEEEEEEEIHFEDEDVQPEAEDLQQEAAEQAEDAAE